MNRPFVAARKFMRRAPSERRLLIAVALLFVSAHVVVRFYSLQRARSMMRSIAVKLRAVAANVDQLAWSIDRVNAALPGTHSCLINAIVCDAVASLSRIPVEFRLGAARAEGGHRFHAWVEHQGSPIVGYEHAEFSPFAQL